MSIVGSDGRGRPGGEAVALTWTRFQRALHSRDVELELSDATVYVA